MDDIYLDHAATTPLHHQVKEKMYSTSTDMFGNPSSIHGFGRKARKAIDDARRVMADSIAASEKEIIFTSGGTEADNLALIGVAFANKAKGKHIITTKQEHHAVLHAVEYLEKEGFEITYLPVYENGKILVEDLTNALRKDTILVSIMFANNETGVLQPIASIGQLLKGHPAYFHTDAVQAYGLFKINVAELGIDLLTVSSHKINGPQGLGFLYSGDHVRINALQYGGEQERKRRPGTENVLGIIGFQKAVELLNKERELKQSTYETYKTTFLNTLTEEDIEFEINGELDSTLSSIVNLSFPGTQVEGLLQNFDLSHIAASSGSACTAGSYQPSHVLSAMFGEDSQRVRNSIRFSFGMNQSVELIEEAARRIAKIIKRLTK